MASCDMSMTERRALSTKAASASCGRSRLEKLEERVRRRGGSRLIGVGGNTVASVAATLTFLRRGFGVESKTPSEDGQGEFPLLSLDPRGNGHLVTVGSSESTGVVVMMGGGISAGLRRRCVVEVGILRDLLVLFGRGEAQGRGNDESGTGEEVSRNISSVLFLALLE